MAEAAGSPGPGTPANQNQRGCTSLLPAPNWGLTSPGGGRPRPRGGLPLRGPQPRVDYTARGSRRREEVPAPTSPPGSPALYSRGLHGSKVRAAQTRTPDARLYREAWQRRRVVRKRGGNLDSVAQGLRSGNSGGAAASPGELTARRISNGPISACPRKRRGLRERDCSAGSGVRLLGDRRENGAGSLGVCAGPLDPRPQIQNTIPSISNEETERLFSYSTKNPLEEHVQD